MFREVKNFFTDRHIALFVFIWSFALGIIVSSLVHISPLIAAFLFSIGCAIASAEKIAHREIPREAILLVLFFVAFGFGALRYDMKDFHETDAAIVASLEQKSEIEGIIIGEPEKRDTSTRFVVKTSSGEKILITADMYSRVKYGDRISVSGTLRVPESVEEEDGRIFNYPEYLAKDDIYYTMSFAHVEIQESGQGNFVKSSLFKIKNAFVLKIKDILPEPESSLLAGLIIAGKDAMPKAIVDAFTRAGLVHIVVLSGSNITIIAEFFRRIFSRFSRRKAASASLVAIALFVLMTGASSTIVRAAIMAMAAMGGKLLGRTYSASRALLSAAFVMLIINPKILAFDPSFKLSFLATLALIYAAPIIESHLSRIPEKFELRPIAAITIATQIVVFPYLLYSMGNVSIIALISNILVLPLVAATMLVGFFATVLAFVHPYIAFPLTYVSHLFLSWILGVANILGNMKYASVQLSMPIWMTITLYLAMCIFVFRFHVNKNAI